MFVRTAGVLCVVVATAAAEPPPGAESGRTDDGDGGDSALRVAGRSLLFVPKLAFEAAMAPVRGTLWAYDRYQLDQLYYRVFFNDARTFGIYPVLGYDTGYGAYGLTAGAKLVERDLFGDGEHLAVTAATGMMYRQIYSVELRSGDRFSRRFSVSLDAGLEQRPHDTFYGIGNGDLVAAAPALVDPRMDETAVDTHYRQQRERVAAIGDLRVVSGLHFRLAGELSRVELGAGDLGMPIDMAYDPAGLVGWNGTSYAYGESEIRWDSRGRATPLESRAVFASGSLVAAFAGRQDTLRGGGDFWRYGLDLQHFFRLGEGPRVLVMRAHGEAVTGSLDEVPFTELPALGGWTYLRGYPLDRFRDRIAAFGSAEYRWDLSDLVQAGVFVDGGRVYDSYRALSLEEMRVGYGFELELHTEASFAMEASIASSIDGGLLMSLAFNPVYDMNERVRRR